ncbi:MAG TPA: M56 family metallopeptidase [Steroidobacteraceae bacterium]
MMLSFLIEALVRSSVLIAAVWVLLQVCRIRHAGGEKFAWTLVAAALLAMPLLIASMVAGTMLPVAILPAQLAASGGALTALPPVAHALCSFLIAVYGVGVAAFAARLGSGLLLGARLRRGAQPVARWGQGMDVRLSAKVHAPVSFGSTVLLPAASVRWDAATLRAVLAHEREHIRNRDGQRLWLASLCRAIFWFNPLVHWLNRRLAILAELTSDAAAVEEVGDRSTYLQVLMRIASAEASPELLLPMASRADLPLRLRRLLSPSEQAARSPASHQAVLGSAVVLLSTLIGACAAKPLVLTGPAAAAALQLEQTPSASQLKSFYPPLLRRRNIQGLVIVRITVDAGGHVVDTRIVAETPAGVGLGAAAQRVARSYQFANRLHRPVVTSLPIKFALQRSASTAPAAKPLTRD